MSFINIYINCTFVLCRLRGLGRRWRATTESSAGDGQVSRPLIPVLVIFPICFLISILYRVIRYPILLILASERSRGIFYRPAARACEGSRLDRAGILVGRQRAPAGSTAGAGRRLPGMTTRHTYFPLFSVSHLKTFPVLYLSPHPCRNSLFSVRSPGEYICGILFGRCTSATSSAGSWPAASLFRVLGILNGPAARARGVIG